MLYKTVLFAFLGFTGIASSMVLGNRDSSVSNPVEARTPPSIIAIADVVDEADE
ncbi:uncharacterized protein GGS22DRAFT_158184 [Annulohypoxylon maeteangense]|uniref:uncharacterized protein n=1 Tax=Annulohypoxylon maeteangense TaxID=1927788 RepID=UPI00200878D0|nr:uncharacterized protein GGS22DRAFT_158184 [Annulohypoxylon maeteangense]KAI0886581.1 hypothetical protein GGS22DRAFT_158184 [Annulohypoxylon maeteangense]